MEGESLLHMPTTNGPETELPLGMAYKSMGIRNSNLESMI